MFGETNWIDLYHAEDIRPVRQANSNNNNDDNGNSGSVSSSDSGSSVSPIAGKADCDFGINTSVDLCRWSNLNLSAFEWIPSKGSDAFWIGGPRRDKNDNNNNGGYAFFETSQLPDSPKAQNTVSAMMASPSLESTGSDGFCISFSYSMDGLSPDKLRLLLHPVNKDMDDHSSNENSSQSESSITDLFNSLDKKKIATETAQMDFRENTVLATIQDGTRGKWRTAQVMYSYPQNHKIIFEAIPKDEIDQSRRYRGYIAVDEIAFKSGDSCKGHCTFDAGFCGFRNAEAADFNWQVRHQQLASVSLVA
eukprot:snap_masked-scaffold309_size213625-processed-gene-1.10 protein:Tk02562 transcript:snap_masked-scaffold309_size213625-processed-gene-1.10-mRNA-1 annotation:"hypothetical protein G5I_00476"